MNDQPPRPPRDNSSPSPNGYPQGSDRQRLQAAQHRWDTVHQNIVTTRVVRGIYYLGGALEILLALRFLLLLFGANQDNLFARFIYNFSAPFAAPLSNLFPAPSFGSTNIFDINIIVGMVAYAILTLLAVRLIWVFWVEQR